MSFLSKFSYKSLCPHCNQGIEPIKQNNQLVCNQCGQAVAKTFDKKRMMLAAFVWLGVIAGWAITKKGISVVSFIGLTAGMLFGAHKTVVIHTKTNHLISYL